MKNIFTILGVAVATSFSAQTNLLTNGGFETWEPATGSTPPKPTGWFISTTGVAQETSKVHSGNSSLKHTAPTGTGNSSTSMDVEAQPNTQYSLGYWVLDNDANARARHWVQARTSSTNITWSGTSFQPSTYTTDSPAWTFVSATSTTPAGTTLLRFDFRTYGENGGGGAVYYDDVVLVKGSLATGEVTASKHRLIKNSAVSSELVFTTKSSVEIFDLTGKLVKTAAVEDGTKLNVAGLAKGTYVIKGLANGELTAQKFIKQ